MKVYSSSARTRTKSKFRTSLTPLSSRSWKGTLDFTQSDALVNFHAHSDPTEELLMIIGIFSYFFALETTLAERQFFRALAKLVGRRSARLSACGIAAIVSKMGYIDEGCYVGADGSLYNVRLCAKKEY